MKVVTYEGDSYENDSQESDIYESGGYEGTGFEGYGLSCAMTKESAKIKSYHTLSTNHFEHTLYTF